MRHDMILPRKVQYGLASAFLAVPIVASVASLSGNIHYNIQFGLWTVVIFAAADVARIVLPTMASLIFGWVWWLRPVMLAVAVACAWCAVNYVADSRFQDLFKRTEASASYADSKSEITRLASELSGIKETSPPAALENQIDVKGQRIQELKGLIADHSDPKRRGPCKDTCEGFKKELGVEQTALGSLQERLGQAKTKASLITQLNVARGSRSTQVTEVKETGLASALAWTGVVGKQAFDMSSVVTNALLYLFLVEGLCYLMAPAIVFYLRVVSAPAVVAEVVEEEEPEEVKFEKTTFSVKTTEDGTLTLTDTKAEEALADISAPALVAEPVVATPEPVVVETAKVAAPVNKARVRDQWGRFTKKRKLPKKPVAKAKAKTKAATQPKFKLNTLPRPKGENVVDLVLMGKLPTKD